MANIDPLARFILSFEGGYSNHPADKGGATNHGVTIATWRAQGYDKNGDGKIDENDVKLITEQDAIDIMRKNFWNKWHADDIEDQGIANLLVDWVWASGKWGITIPQQLLGVKADGIVGPKTLREVNRLNCEYLFDKLKKRRLEYINNLVRNNPSQKVFIKGWSRRINSIYHYLLIDNNGNHITWR